MFLCCLSCHFCFARMLNRFWWNLWEVVTTTNILNYILGKNCNTIRGAGYASKFESTSSGFAAMSNRWWLVANEFTVSEEYALRQMRSQTISCQFKDFTYKFQIQMNFKTILFSLILQSRHKHLNSPALSLHV